jgi:hypothetical protein
MTNEYFQMIGMFHVPLIMMSKSTGLSEEETKASMDELQSDGFCMYDADNEYVWVIDMARTQVSDGKLSPQQQKGVLNSLSRVYLDEESIFVQNFLDHYRTLFSFLPNDIDDLYFDQ